MSGLYWTNNALGPLANAESGGNPLAQNPASTASGLYGFTNSTWQQYAAAAGVDTTRYKTAASAPANIQSAVALQTPISNWTCPNCDATAVTLANDPANVTNSPVTYAAADGGLSFSMPDSPGADIAGSVGMGDNPYQDVPTGSAAGAPGASTGTSWFTNLVANVENWFQRGSLIIVGIVLIAAAAFALSHKGAVHGSV